MHHFSENTAASQSVSFNDCRKQPLHLGYYLIFMTVCVVFAQRFLLKLFMKQYTKSMWTFSGELIFTAATLADVLSTFNTYFVYCYQSLLAKHSFFYRSERRNELESIGPFEQKNQKMISAIKGTRQNLQSCIRSGSKDDSLDKRKVQ